MIVSALVVLVAFQIWKLSVTDQKIPEFHIEDGILEISVHDDIEAYLQGITAQDNKDGDVTDSIVVEKYGQIGDNNEFVVTYAAFDQAGNVAKQRRTVRFRDYVSPRFSLDAPLLFLYGRDVSIEKNVHVYDVIDGNISHKIKPTVVSQVPLSSEGIHEMLFRVTNSMGDTVELQLPVEIYPTGKYDANLTLKEYLIYLPKGSSFNAEDYLGTFYYQDMDIALWNGVPLNLKLTISGHVNADVQGVYPVAYTVSFEQGQNTISAISKLIVIVEG
jgi:hypothetical protein